MAVAGRQTSQAAREIQDVLNERDPSALGVLATGTASGVVIAQEVADRVLPAAGFQREPTDAMGFLASSGVKGGVAVAFGVLGARLSGLPLLFAAFGGVGALAGAGADLFNAVQQTGFLAEGPLPNQGQQGHAGTTQQSAASGGSGSSANGASPSAGAGGMNAQADIAVG